MEHVFLKQDIKLSLDFIFDIAKSYSNINSYELIKILSKKPTFNDRCKNEIYSIFHDHIVKCETISPGSSKIFFDKLILKNDFFIEKKSRILKKEKLKTLFATFATKEQINLILDALELAGLKGKVVLDTTNFSFDNDVVELNSGNFFPGLVPEFKIKSTKFLHVKVACIDGYIESVSEIHKMLEDCSHSKESLIIFLRGLSDDVKNTLKVNYDRGTLSVIPVIIPFDVDGINILNDIAIVCGTDVFSSLKGQLFSSIDISSLPRIDFINLTSYGSLIENTNTSTSVSRHISFLQKKIISSENETSIQTITKRIQNLGMNRVLIKLSDNHKKLKKTFMIDNCLRALKLSTSYGISEYCGKLYPSSSLTVGELYAKKFIEHTQNIGAILVA